MVDRLTDQVEFAPSSPVDALVRRIREGLLLPAPRRNKFLQAESRPIAAADLEVISKGPGGRGGIPLLFVHGAWHGAWCWDDGFLDRMAAYGFEVHAMSLRGHGKSAGRERLRGTRLRDFVADVEAVAACLSRPPVLIGHSMGAFVVQKCLQRRAYAGSILMAPMPPTGVGGLLARMIRRDPLTVLKSNLTLRLDHVMKTSKQVRRWLFSSRVPEATVERCVSRLQDEAFLAYLDMLVFDRCKAKPSKRPLLVVGGGQDKVFPPHVMQQVARAYGVRPVMFPEMGHDMMLEPGWDVLADTIAVWLHMFCAPRRPMAAGRRAA